jgi:hypothetical protein
VLLVGELMLMLAKAASAEPSSPTDIKKA